jgi:hypothetical protein
MSIFFKDTGKIELGRWNAECGNKMKESDFNFLIPEFQNF